MTVIPALFREKQNKERREQGGSIFMVITFMAVCPIPLPDGFSYLLSFFSFIISYSFSCFSSSVSFSTRFLLPLHFIGWWRISVWLGLAAFSSSLKRFSRVESLHQLRIPFTSLSPRFSTEKQSQEQGCPPGPDFDFFPVRQHTLHIQT